MNPNEQLLNILTKHYLNAQDNIAEADAVAIEAIQQYAKDYAKQMCDKQKLECTKVGYAMDAPYPKELI
jgi:hypothetical protein